MAKRQHHPDNPFGEVFRMCGRGEDRYKKNHPLRFPRCIDIELTNTCNFTCKMCPTGQHAVKRPLGFMTKETYREILKQIKEYKTPIRFVRFGEPTVHADLEKFIVMAHEQYSKVHINTNGFYVLEGMMKAFLDIHLDSIKFSFQGCNYKEYNFWRNKNFFNDLISNIRTFHSMRENGQFELPFIVIGTTITSETEEDVAIFKSKVEKYCDLFLVGKTEDLTAIRSSPKACPEVFDKLSVNWDGTVSACCGDYDNKMLVGDIKEETLLDIWFGAKLAYYREMIVGKQHSGLELCRSCIR